MDSCTCCNPCVRRGKLVHQRSKLDFSGQNKGGSQDSAIRVSISSLLTCCTKYQDLASHPSPMLQGMVRILSSSTRATDRPTPRSKQTLRLIKRNTTHHLNRNIKMFAHTLNVGPILLPFASVIRARLVPSVPIAHIYCRQVKILHECAG